MTKKHSRALEKAIRESFQRERCCIFTDRELKQFLSQETPGWGIDENLPVTKIIERLLRQSKLQKHRFKLPYRSETRYWWGDVPTLEIIQSLRPEGYFSHFTALQLHNLTNRDADTVYLNFEQNLTGGGGDLSQVGIDRAFKGKCRVSSNIATFREHKICIINGRKTGQLGVEEITTDEGAKIRRPNIERTLLDITVRPIYSGGTDQVAEAFEAAHDQFSVKKLAMYLRKLNYTYPYHQAVGFYLERTGLHSGAELDILRQFEIRFDFYLDYKMEASEYIPEWKLHVPKGLK